MTPPENSSKKSTRPPRSAITTGFEPRAEQLARAAALRRFNRLVVYLPGGLITAVVLITFFFLL